MTDKRKPFVVGEYYTTCPSYKLRPAQKSMPFRVIW